MSKLSKLINMFGGYTDNFLQALWILFGADCIHRLFLCAWEYHQYPDNYLPETRIMEILQRAFSYNNRTRSSFLLLLLSTIGRFAFSKKLFVLPPPISMIISIMPIYWICTYVGINESTLTYSNFIRGSHGLDYGEGMASNYFHGYLKLSLPSKRTEGLKKLIEKYEDSQQVEFAFKKLIILIPDELYASDIIDSKLLDKATPLEMVTINRAGVSRPFRHAVYRITEQINGRYYYITMEYATPLVSFFETISSTLSGKEMMQEMKREIWLKFCKHLKHLIKSWPETRHVVDVRPYSARDVHGNLVDVGELVKALIPQQT